MKWIFRAFILAATLFVSVAIYDKYKAGFFSMPDLPDDAYPISFANGLRGIVYDMKASTKEHENTPKLFRSLALANKDRKYLGIPMDVAPWFQEVWSTCKTEDGANAQMYFEKAMPDDLKQQLQGARFEALCFIETDDTNLVRGAIYSVPKL